MIQRDIDRVDDAAVLSRYLTHNCRYNNLSLRIFNLCSAQTHITGTVQCKCTFGIDITQHQTSTFLTGQINILTISVDDSAVIENTDTIICYTDIAFLRSQTYLCSSTDITHILAFFGRHLHSVSSSNHYLFTCRHSLDR